jgi:hypothetical protein
MNSKKNKLLKYKNIRLNNDNNVWFFIPISRNKTKYELIKIDNSDVKTLIKNLKIKIRSKLPKRDYDFNIFIKKFHNYKGIKINENKIVKNNNWNESKNILINNNIGIYYIDYNIKYFCEKTYLYCLIFEKQIIEKYK